MGRKEAFAELEDDLEQDLLPSNAYPNCCFGWKGKKSQAGPSQISPQTAGRGSGLACALAPAPQQGPWVTMALVPECPHRDGAGGQSEVTGMQLDCTH